MRWKARWMQLRARWIRWKDMKENDDEVDWGIRKKGQLRRRNRQRCDALKSKTEEVARCILAM